MCSRASLSLSLFCCSSALFAVLASHVEEALDGPNGFDVAAARKRLIQRRDVLTREHARVAKLLHTFRDVSRRYGAKGAADK